MTNKQSQKNKRVILKTLTCEINGDIKTVLKYLHKDYSMTWVYKRKDGVLFPSESISDLNLNEVYRIKGRAYKIKHIIAEKNVVMAELIESYPDPKKKITYRTPMVIVWEFKNGKIKNGRHYCDPQLSYENLTREKVNKIYK